MPQLPMNLIILLALAGLCSASVPAVVLNSGVADFNGLSSARVNAKQLADALAGSVAALPSAGVLLIFNIDEGLALADFAKSGDVFAGENAGSSAFVNVAALSNKLNGRHLLVSDAANLLPTLRSVDWRRGSPVDVAAGSVGDVDRIIEASSTTGGSPRLVIVRAADASAADRILGAACAALQSRGLPFVAVFTAARETTPSAAAESAAGSGRHLLAVPTPEPNSNGTFVNCSGDVLLYYSSLQASIKQSGKLQTLPAVPSMPDGSSIIDTSLSQCATAGGNRTLVLAYPQSALPAPIASLKLTLNFIGDRSKTGIWRVISGTAALSCRSGSSANCTNVAEAALTAQSLASFTTPNGSCYHCTGGVQLATISGSASNSTPSLILAFKKFQLQPFGVLKGGRFSNQVNDCVGFFSVEVWFSLLVLLVITVILMYGVLMLVSVATPDRFDDPKGKTIQVNVQEGGN